MGSAGRARWRAWIADQVPDPESRRYRFGAAAREAALTARTAWHTAEQRARSAGLAVPSGAQLVPYRGRRIPAAVAAIAGTHERHLAAAAAVGESLQGAGIRHFAYTDATTRVRIGVLAGDRARALTALARWSRTRAVPMARATGAAGRLEVDPIEAPARSPRTSEVIALPVVDPAATLVLGLGEGVPIDWWDAHPDGRLTTRAANRWATSLPAAVQQDAELELAGLRLPTLAPFADPHVDDVRAPVDAVVTWVDSADPAWRHRYAVAGGPDLGDERQASRFRALDELRFALRSIATFAGWVRHVYLVTDRQVPHWLRTDDRLTVVDHRELWPDADALPVFNSHAIEARLHHIPGLAEHWLYVNDDMLLGRATQPEQFVAGNGSARFFAAGLHVGFGAPGPGDGTPSLAGRNDRDLLRQATGTVQTLKLHHAPYPQRTSVADELERTFPAQYERTWRSRFRADTDISAITLQTWYGWATGRFLPGKLALRYYDLRTDQLAGKLRYVLRRRHLDTLCLNMGEEEGRRLTENAPLAADFLPRYLPYASPWET